MCLFFTWCAKCNSEFVNFLPSKKLSTEVNQEFLYCLIRQSQDGIALSQLGIF